MEDQAKNFSCPLTKKIMLCPVKTVDGSIYEREAIEDWLSKNNYDPISKKMLSAKTLADCNDIQDSIFKFLKDHPKYHQHCYKPSDWKKVVLPRIAEYPTDTLALFSLLGAPKELVNSQKLNKIIKKSEQPNELSRTKWTSMILFPTSDLPAKDAKQEAAEHPQTKPRTVSASLDTASAKSFQWERRVIDQKTPVSKTANGRPLDKNPFRPLEKSKKSEEDLSFSTKQLVIIEKPQKFISQVGIHCEQNPKFRPSMEDEHVFIENFPTENAAFFGVYDGHGGKSIAEYLGQNFHKTLALELEKNPKNPEMAILSAFTETDNEILAKGKEDVGSTAAIVYIKRESTQTHLYSANIGDARTVLCRKEKAERISKDHKPSDPEETKRIKSLANGFVINGRLAGFLGVSRAFGDTALRDYGLSSVPFQYHTTLTSDDTFMIVACDGVWDVFSDQDAVKFVSEQLKVESAEKVAKELVEAALKKGSRDNITAMIVKFNV